KGFIDKTVYDTTSILRTIEARWGLPPLTDRDRKATDLSAAFDFGR
ncbi:MAG: phospholipase, partial [Alphaproteobacteria bacterium]|nr:phospholipase [Alphaproteobacteria bacterium]